MISQTALAIKSSEKFKSRKREEGEMETIIKDKLFKSSTHYYHPSDHNNNIKELTSNIKKRKNISSVDSNVNANDVSIPKRISRDKNLSDPFQINLQNDLNKSSGTVLVNNSSSLSNNLDNSIKTNRKKKIDFGELSRYIFLVKKDMNNQTFFIGIKEQEFLMTKYNYNSALQCIVSLISISSVIIEYEISFRNNSSNGYNVSSTFVNENSYHNNVDLFVLWICFISSILLWGLIITEYLIECKILHLTKKMPERVWRKESGNVCNLVITILVFFVHPNPLFKDLKVPMYNSKYEVMTYYSLNSIFGLLSMLRLWFFVKFFIVSSEFYSSRLQRICEMNSFDKSLMFSMKANMVKKPYAAYLILFISILVFCSFGMRIFERELDFYSERNFASYWNVIWCLIITMTTVGYGDFFPSTLYGRMIGIISCVCGVFLISMLVVTITNVLNFEGNEKTVFLLLERISLMEDKEILSARLVSKYFRMMKMLKRKEAIKDQNKEDLRDDLLLQLHYFKNNCNEIKSTYPPYSGMDIILDNLTHLEKCLEDLNAKKDL